MKFLIITLFLLLSVTLNARMIIGGASNDVSETFIITASTGTGGGITPSGLVVVNSGEDTTFTIDTDVNYRYDTLIVDGVDTDPVTTYTFIAVAETHTISCSFTNTLPEYEASDVLLYSCDTERSAAVLASWGVTKFKGINIDNAYGTFRIKADAKIDVNESAWRKGLIGKAWNNISLNQQLTTSYVTYSVDIVFTTNQDACYFGESADVAGSVWYVKNFRIYGTKIGGTGTADFSVDVDENPSP